MARRGAFFNRYKPGAVDGEKALRHARAVLLNARGVDHLDAESFARSWGLKVPTAASLIEQERARRG